MLTPFFIATVIATKAPKLEDTPQRSTSIGVVVPPVVYYSPPPQPAPEPQTKPIKIQPVEPKAVPKAPESSIHARRNAYSPNLYQSGQCVWGVKEWRPDIPGNWHSAYQWLAGAARDDWPIGSTPAVNAVGVKGNHVVLILAVHGDMVTEKEMNYDFVPYHTRVKDMPASSYEYIY